MFTQYKQAPSTADKIKLSPGQSVFFKSPHKYNLATCGLGGGKSFIGCLRMIERAGSTPGSLNLIAAPTYPMLRDATMRTFYELAPPGFILDFNQNNGEMIVRAGKGTSTILWRSLVKYDFLRGIEFAYAYIDEIALCHPEAWKILKGRLRQFGKSFFQQAWATTTPRGKNWIYDEFVAQATTRHAWIHWPGTDNLPNLPDGYYDDMGYTGSFYDQEVLGLFTAFEGLVYDFIDDPRLRDTHVRIPSDALRYRDVVGGLDWGWRDPTAAVVFGLYGDRMAWQLDEYYETRADIETRVVPNVIELTQKYGVSTWYADSSRPDLIETVRRAFDRQMIDAVIRPADKSPGSIKSGIITMQSLLAQRGDGARGLYVHPRCTNTRKEYGAYQYSTKDRLDRNKDELPADFMNHACDASRYVLHSVYGQEKSGAIATARSHARKPAIQRLLEEVQHEYEQAVDSDDPWDDEREEFELRRKAQAARSLNWLRGWGE